MPFSWCWKNHRHKQQMQLGELLKYLVDPVDSCKCLAGVVEWLSRTFSTGTLRLGRVVAKDV